MKNAVLTAESLVKVYGEGESRFEAIRGVSVRLERGEFIALSGPSGCGKSTLLNMIGLALPPSAGTVHLDGELVDFTSDDASAKLRRTKIGYVFQYFNLLPTLTAVENAALGLILSGAPASAARKKALELLERLDLGHRADRLPSELSGGEMQRVAIARACIHEPILILADEPTGNLDIERGDRVLDLLQAQSDAGRTVLMATHSDRARARTSRTIELADGRIAG